MTLRSWGWLAAVSALLAQGHPDIERAQALSLAGRDRPAAAVLDSLLALPELSRRHRGEALYLRAVWSEDPEVMERGLERYLQEYENGPRSAEAEMRLGRLDYARRHVEEALLHFDRAAEKGLREEGALWKGLCASVLGQSGSAQENLSRAAESGNGKIRHRALMALGDLQRRSRDFEKALDTYARVREESRQGPGWWSAATYHMVACHEALDDPRAAEAMILELVEESPQSYEAGLVRDRLQMQNRPLPPSAGEADAPAQFLVQLGAFTVVEHAARLADSLRTLGYPVQVQSGDAIHRVLVGGYGTRDEAAAVGDSLDTRFKSGYQIIEPDGR